MLLTLAAFGQGQVNFDNLVVGYPIILPDGTGPGAAGKAQLYLRSSGGSYSPVGPIQGFLTSSPEAAKYIVQTVVTIPGIDIGQMATLQIRSWADSAPTWDASSIRGSSSDVTVTLGGGTIVPPNLDGLNGFLLVPEPSALALGALGVGLLCFRSRK